MADSLLSKDPLERYGVIERAYCEENWSAVIHDAQALIADLERAAEGSPEGLKERLQLLIGHSFLYGLGDRDSAEDHYQAVLHSGAEVSLRQIAEQGLQQCALPVAPPESQEVEPAEESSPSGPPSSLEAGTSGWPETAALASPPDSTGVSDADHASAPQEDSSPLPAFQDSWGSEAASLPPEEASPPREAASALSWLTAEPTAAPQTLDSSALPVMPWLETDAAAATAAVPAVLLEPAIQPEDLPLRQEEPLQPVPESLSPQEEQARMPLMATFAEVAPVAEVPVVVPPADRPDSQEVSAAFPETALASSEGLEGSPASPPASAAEERLVADVVEEPELIELYQAEGPAPEELLAQPIPEDSVPSAAVEGGIQASPPAEPEPPAGIERPEMDSLPGQALNRWAEPEQAPEPEPIPPEELASRPASPRVPVASGVGPFSAPPEPVAEEDPELLLGLLKVEMG